MAGFLPVIFDIFNIENIDIATNIEKYKSDKCFELNITGLICVLLNVGIYSYIGMNCINNHVTITAIIPCNNLNVNNFLNDIYLFPMLYN